MVLNLVRIGKRAIVSFPNFAHWRMRMSLLLQGRMPRTELLPMPWYETPNIHFCSISDFAQLCAEEGVTIERKHSLDGHGLPP